MVCFGALGGNCASGPMRRFDLDRLTVCSSPLEGQLPRARYRLTARRRPACFARSRATAFAALLVVTPQAQTGTTIRIWKVGSPHTGDTPHTEMPPALAREAGSRGWRLSIEAFPAQAFADRFFAADRNGSVPDILVFDNFGIIDGIVTNIGHVRRDRPRSRHPQPAHPGDQFVRRAARPCARLDLPLDFLGELRRCSRAGAQNTAL